MQLTETARIRLLIDGKEAASELSILDSKYNDLIESRNKFTRGSDDWKEFNEAAKETKNAINAVRERMEVTNMTFTESVKYQKEIIKAMKGMVEGSDDYNKSAAKLKEVNTHLSGIKKDLNAVDSSVQKQKSTWDNLKGWIQGAFAVTGILELFNSLKNFASGSLEEAKKFQSAAQSLRGEVTMTDEQFKALKKSATENGAAFGMTGEEMLKAYNAIASGKSDLIDVKGGIEAVTDAAIKLATNGEMQLEESAKVMTSSLNQFGAEAKDAAKFVDILSTGTIVGAGKIQEIGMALKYVGPIAKAAGLSFGETNAALQILHQNGIKGEQAGTALRGMLSKLLKGADETNPSIVGMATAMENLAKKQLNAKDMTELFGQEAVSAGIAIVSNSAKLKEWTATIEKGGGAAAMYAEKTKTVEFNERQAAAAYANSRQEIGEKLLPIWVSLINFFTEYGIPSIKAVATGFIAVLQGLIELPKFIAENKELFIGLGVALLSLNTANIAAASSALYMAAAEKGRAVVTKASAAAQWLLNAAMTANPIGLVIAAIATLTGGIVWAYKNIDWFRAGIQATWAGLKEFLKMIWDVNVAFLKLDFSGAWNRIKNGWSSVSKASGDAYASAMAESNKRVADNTVKTTKDTGTAVVKANKETAGKVVEIDKETGKQREATAKKTAKELEKAHKDMLKEIEKSNELADKTIKKSLEDHVKAVKVNNANELKAHTQLQEDLRENALKMASFKDAVLKLERVKIAKSVDEIEDIEREYAEKALKRDLENSKEKLALKEREFKMLKALGLLYKEEEDKRSSEIAKLKSEVADKELAIVKKGVADKQKALKESAAAVDEMWKQEVEAYKQSVEEQKETAEKMAEHFNRVVGEVTKIGYSFAQTLLGNAGNEIDDLISGTTDKVEKARLQTQKISNEMGKSFIDTVASFATGDVSGGISGLIGVLTGAVDLFNQNALILVAELEVLYDNMSSDADFLIDNLSKVKEIYKGLVFDVEYNAPLDVTLTTFEILQDAQLKIGENIVKNYNLAVEKEDDYNAKRKAGIEESYALDVQRINDKYALLDAKAQQAQTAESLALIESGNNALLELIKTEDSKTSVVAEYNQKRSKLLKDTALADMQITDDMDAATIKAINDARDLRTKSLVDLAKWYQDELVFTVNNEGQKRKEYSATEAILKGIKENQDTLDLKYAMDAIEREKLKTQELITAENNKNLLIEKENKRHNDELTRLGVEKDLKLTESFNTFKNLFNAGYEEMIKNAEMLYQKGIINGVQLNELLDKLNTYRNLLNGPQPGGQPPYIEPIVLPKFANGGIFKDSSYFENHGVLGGLSHNTPEGGNWVINPRNGKLLAKVEANEWIGVVSKNLTSRYSGLLSQLAQSSIATTGKPVYAANGFMGKLESPAFVSSSTMAPTFSMEEFLAAFAAQVSIMQNINENIKLTVPLLESVASSSKASAAKKLAININNIHEASDIIADINQRSSFRA